MMKRSRCAILALLVATLPSMARAAAIGGDGPSQRNIIGAVNYTQVTDTMTRVGGMGAVTVFSTITIPANTLARNGDSIRFTCAGTLTASSENRTIIMKVGEVVISSRTGSYGGTAPSAWSMFATLIRVSPGNQIRTCEAPSVVGACSATAAAPTIGAGVNTIDETQPMVFTCGADNVTAGGTSFLYSNAQLIPGP